MASACAAGRVEIIDQIPGQDAVDAAGWLRQAVWRRTPGRSAVVPGTHVLLEVGVEILDEDLAAERLAEERQVRPDDRTRDRAAPERPAPASVRRNFLSAFVGWAGASPVGGADSMRGQPGASERPATPQARQEPRETAARLVRQLDSSRAAGCGRRRRRRPSELRLDADFLSARCASHGGCGVGAVVRLAIGLASAGFVSVRRLPAGALHVDAAAEVRAFRDRHARRDDVAVHRSLVADVDLLARGHVAR